MNTQVSQISQVSGSWKPGSQSTDQGPQPSRSDVYRAICERVDCYDELYVASGETSNRKKATRLEKQAMRYLECGKNMVLFKCHDCHQHFAGFSRCESRLCPDCMRKYANSLWHRAKSVVQVYPPQRTLRWMLLTLTLQVDRLRILRTDDFRKLTKSARKLINTLYPKDHGAGAIASIEVGKGKNIHLHALVYGEYHSQAAISDMWLKITETSKIVDIRATDRPLKKLGYIIKYIAKPPLFQTAEDQAEYLDAITGVRRIHTYGIFYNHKLLKREPVECPICGGRLKYRCLHPGEALPLDTILFSEAFEKKVAIN